MTEPISAREQVAREAIARAAHATGVDFAALLATARRESSLNPQARAGTSSAAGMFQFIESTWMDMVRRHGAAHGLGDLAARADEPSARRQILDLRFDPDIAARMAGELWKENAAFLRGRLGRNPNETELYAAHVMGPAGAARLIDAAARGAGDASALFPREAAANRHLFFADGAPRSASALMQRLALDVGTPTPPVLAPNDATSPTASAPAPLLNGTLSPALIDALFAIALGLDAPEDEDPALRLLRDV
ncbi:MAG: transglycosylase SLT domain-containing protein [Alphaproteobacteria bacterium]|nr:transglycosylase SLT domain-containing protein [Alphaproteobacteria bacterium]